MTTTRLLVAWSAQLFQDCIMTVADSSRTAVMERQRFYEEQGTRDNIDRASKACIVLAILVFVSAFVGSFFGVYVVDLGMKSGIAQVLGAGVITMCLGLVGLVTSSRRRARSFWPAVETCRRSKALRTHAGGSCTALSDAGSSLA
jgi:hypothetical protein